MKDFFNKNRKRIIGFGGILLLFVGIFRGFPVPVLIASVALPLVVLMFENELFGGKQREAYGLIKDALRLANDELNKISNHTGSRAYYLKGQVDILQSLLDELS